MMDNDEGNMQTTLQQRVYFYTRGIRITVLICVHLQGMGSYFYMKHNLRSHEMRI